MSQLESTILQTLKQTARPFEHEQDLDELILKMADSKVVLLGEASHGTHEYYTWRSLISRRLITEHGFSFIAVEGDWPDCYKLNRYAKAYPDSGLSAREVMQDFNRWPTWMWANWEVVALIEWLRLINQHHDNDHKTGFYGLDVYSLWESMDAVKSYLSLTDPSVLKLAEKAYSCFEPYSEDEGQSYARATEWYNASCEDEVVNLLTELRKKRPRYDSDKELAFSTEQNALVMVNAERYYREMIKGGGGSWNVRDTHMMETLERLLDFHGQDSKAIVWEHNTHVGDACYTDMASEGLINIGQLAREKYGEENVFIAGFGSYAGKVMAGRGWGMPMQEMLVPEAVKGSFEEFAHRAVGHDAWFFSEDLAKDKVFNESIAHRAIGVVYDPRFERSGNYVPTIFPKRYDAFLFIDESKALHPIPLEVDEHEIPETYPWGI